MEKRLGKEVVGEGFDFRKLLVDVKQ